MPGSSDIYDLTQSDTLLQILFSSTMSHIDDACAAVTLFLESKGPRFSPHLFAVNLVMREGLTNAVRHGNKSDPHKRVAFILDIGRKDIIGLRIEDQGKGFNWQSTKKALLDEKADHGRGMPIMTTYFDRCEYNLQGNILYLEKKIGA
ncbi:MAG: ATP-binding protein [Desulfobacter sp.]|nr:ATP-binding protein [Desulfobacter sp.]